MLACRLVCTKMRPCVVVLDVYPVDLRGVHEKEMVFIAVNKYV